MIKTAIIFGGSGYIGRNMLNVFLRENRFSRYIVCDLKKLEGFENEEKVLFEHVDVRNPIEIEVKDCDVNGSWIFNFAAIHREPGHAYHEYFDTNLPGAHNISNLARKIGIKNIYFTSSIAPYGRSRDVRTENSNLYPETAYGISKAIAEKIHEAWLAESTDRRLIICRPSVIFGPRDPGNVYRMIKNLKKGTFILPNGGNVIKAYGYVFGLMESILFTMNQNKRYVVYNYAENPLVPLNEMTKIVKQELAIGKPVLKLPTSFLVILSAILQIGYSIIGKKSDIHPVRVKKAGFPTNIRSQYLIDNNFKFKYDFKNALKHWKSFEPNDF